ncbi:hypothetical protein E8E13_007211 [Curvularia kusanoi]|uniref:DUF7730 domain-containing protein n=1 Tax=Curvularia kusanoi TaxID=90978 RepID=A0A9P4TES7_CURKU|nr:hypothetical protein E8E13_007211 [Curvularia kusanoi]
MAPHKPNSGSVQEPDLSSTDIGGATATEPQGNHRGRSSVACYDNGLLNLEKTPAHLISVAQSNAESPLLRLPREIRDLIWKFACGGHYMTTWSHSQPHGAPKIRKLTLHADREKGLLARFRPSENVSSAFSLPRVCRQVYSETALTAYRECVFVLDKPSDLRTIEETFLKVQRNAIVALDLHHMIVDVAILPPPLIVWVKTSVRRVLPNLRRLHVTDFELCCIHERCVRRFGDWMSKEDKELHEAKDKQAWFLRWYTGILESGIEIVFQD